ncbi:hypothetical protein PMIN01_11146 [Paraphaeosphaeria minitans]|uniref:Uncharacterized protein n=1 Tax=Paraphaeosphaeria minitans TaxID=565426 RepID=A0A9P6G941_9PLEO|nr:hypothetical protein PMIN01_11146 [Paraphaeosphaeria minitans]
MYVQGVGQITQYNRLPSTTHPAHAHLIRSAQNANAAPLQPSSAMRRWTASYHLPMYNYEPPLLCLSDAFAYVYATVVRKVPVDDGEREAGDPLVVQGFVDAGVESLAAAAVGEGVS